MVNVLYNVYYVGLIFPDKLDLIRIMVQTQEYDESNLTGPDLLPHLSGGSVVYVLLPQGSWNVSFMFAWLNFLVLVPLVISVTSETAGGPPVGGVTYLVGGWKTIFNILWHISLDDYFRTIDQFLHFIHGDSIFN